MLYKGFANLPFVLEFIPNINLSFVSAAIHYRTYDQSVRNSTTKLLSPGIEFSAPARIVSAKILTGETFVGWLKVFDHPKKAKLKAGTKHRELGCRAWLSGDRNECAGRGRPGDTGECGSQ